MLYKISSRTLKMSFLSKHQCCFWKKISVLYMRLVNMLVQDVKNVILSFWFTWRRVLNFKRGLFRKVWKYDGMIFFCLLVIPSSFYSIMDIVVVDLACVFWYWIMRTTVSGMQLPLPNFWLCNGVLELHSRSSMMSGLPFLLIKTF